MVAARAVTIYTDVIDEALRQVLSAADDLAPVFKNIGEYQVGSTKQRFKDEKDPDGQRWKDLNPIYAQTKKGPRILTGRTRSLSQIIYQAAEQSVEIGSNLIYARIHQEGGDIRAKNGGALVFSMGRAPGGKNSGEQVFKLKKVTIPRRSFLGINAADQERIEEIVRDHFEEALARAGVSQ